MKVNKTRMIIRLVIIVIAAAIGWLGKDKQANGTASATPVKPASEAQNKRANGYQVFLNPSLIPSKYNDGDSFLVKHGDQEVEYRLYYVDSPESRDKPFDDHKRRVSQQADALGGIRYDQAISVGKAAKKFTTTILQKPFRVFTKGELVFNGPRQYAFIEVEYEGKKRWLHEVLVQEGLARIHTKGEETPDGQSFYDHRDDLRDLEHQAKRKSRGAWKF